MITIRSEQPQDVDGIRHVNAKAFGQSEEADLVDKLRRNCDDILSLVALEASIVVGHVLFSPAVLENEGETVVGSALAPVAVLPAYQKQGIGTALIQKGLHILTAAHCPFVIVLGHPEYYPRFGFEQARKNGIQCEWDVPDDAFMILMLDEQRIKIRSGMARYRPEFSEL